MAVVRTGPTKWLIKFARGPNSGEATVICGDIRALMVEEDCWESNHVVSFRHHGDMSLCGIPKQDWARCARLEDQRFDLVVAELLDAGGLGEKIVPFLRHAKSRFLWCSKLVKILEGFSEERNRYLKIRPKVFRKFSHTSFLKEERHFKPTSPGSYGPAADASQEACVCARLCWMSAWAVRDMAWQGP